jgi:hypothetical protein
LTTNRKQIAKKAMNKEQLHRHMAEERAKNETKSGEETYDDDDSSSSYKGDSGEESRSGSPQANMEGMEYGQGSPPTTTARQLALAREKWTDYQTPTKSGKKRQAKKVQEKHRVNLLHSF